MEYVCAGDFVVETVRSVEALAMASYQQYKKDVLIDRVKSIHDVIKKNSLALFSSPKQKKEIQVFTAASSSKEQY